MSALFNLSFRGKLMLSIVFVLALASFFLFRARHDIQSLQQLQKRLYEEDFVEQEELLQFKALLTRNHEELLILSLSTNVTVVNARTGQLQSEMRQLAALADDAERRAGNNAILRPKYAELRSLRTAFADVVSNEMLPMLREGRTNLATALMLGDQRDRAQKIYGLVDDIGKVLDEDVHKAMAESDAMFHSREQLLLAMAVILLLTSAGVLVFLGNLTARMNKVTRELQEGVNVLSATSGQLATTINQGAASTSETATSVSETAAATEEVRQTSQLASEKAKRVAESSRKAADISREGRRAVEASIEGTRDIRQQMEFIAQTVVQLSERNQAIGEIIASVNELAEQSNLLAVNAAIEAAKAGEQGRGFAVVAREIKRLAEQSKQSTGRIRGLLNDVQKAVSAAVLATEKGTHATEAGSKQAAEAGESIRLLFEAINESSQAALQIAAATGQQLTGMDQITHAIADIKAATTQNAEATRQMEQSARGLNDLGASLKQIAARLNV